MIDDVVRVLKALLDHEPPKPEPKPNDTWYAAIAKANEQIRSTAKWILTSFAAIGAILLGTIQLSSVGKLTGETPPDRIGAAIAGAAVALVGVVIALWYTSSVLFPFLNSFRLADEHPEITDHLFGEPYEILGYDYATLKQRWKDAGDAVDRATDATRAAAQEEWAKMREKKRVALVHVGTELLRIRFDDARRAIVTGAVLVAVGLGLFAWGANPPAAPVKPAVSLGAAPVQLTAHLTPAGVAALAAPRGCKTTDVTLLQIGGKPEAREVLVAPAPGCTSVRFVLTPELGTAVAAG